MERLLSEICTIQYGYPFDSSQFSETEGTPLIRIRDVVRGFSKTYTTEPYKPEYIVNEDDLLIGMDGEFNIAKWGKTPALLNQRVCRLIPGDEVDKSYLYYFMPSALKEIEEKTPFATVKHLSAKVLNKISVPLPPLQEQQHVAKVLDAVGALIAKRKQQIALLDELVKSRFIELFGDIAINSNHWQTVPLDRICDGIGDGLHGTPEYTENGDFPFINGNNLWDGTIVITSSTKMVNQKVYEDNYIAIGSNAILISINGTLGKLAFYNGERVMLGKSACYCNLKSEVNRVFVYWLMKTDAFMKYLEDNSTKSTIKNVGLKAMRNYPIIVPPVDLQNEFATFVEQTDKLKLTIQQSIDKLETMKKALMQEYFG